MDASLPAALRYYPIAEIDGDKSKRFRAYLLGYSHIDPAGVYRAEGRLHLLVAIDHTTKLPSPSSMEERHGGWQMPSFKGGTL